MVFNSGKLYLELLHNQKYTSHTISFPEIHSALFALLSKRRSFYITGEDHNYNILCITQIKPSQEFSNSSLLPEIP